jgi:uncharacterized membrane protein YgcG
MNIQSLFIFIFISNSRSVVSYFQVFCSRSRVIVLWSIIALSLVVLNSHFFITAHYPIVVNPLTEDAAAATASEASSSSFPLVVDADPRHLDVRNSSPAAVVDGDYNNYIPTQSDDDNATVSAAFAEPLRETVAFAGTPIITMCYVSAEYEWFLNNVWYWIDFVVLSAVPFLVVAVGNCVIGVCVVRAVRFRKHQHRSFGGGMSTRRARASSSSSSEKRMSRPSAGDVSVFSGVSGAVGGGGGGGGGLRERKTIGAGDRYSAAMTSSTLMLMSVSVTFLLTTVPNVIYFLKVDEWLTSAELDPDRVAGKRREAWVRLVYAITNLLLYTNNSINFLLYCLTGSRFRRAARDLFARGGGARPSAANGGGFPGAAHVVNGGASNGTVGGRRVAAVAATTPRARASTGGRMTGRCYSSVTITD